MINFIVKLKSLIKRKFFFLCCLTLSRYSSKKFPFLIRLFKLSIAQLGDSIYYESYINRKSISNCISKIKSLDPAKNQFDKLKETNEIKSIIKSLNKVGIYENIKISISKEDRNRFVNYINKSNYYDSHVISKKAIKSSNETPSGAYKSYGYDIQLNNPTLLNLCLNPKLLKIAEIYLGCIPNIDSINTFVTLPKKESFTHEFHRDLNNLNQLVVFIYWTKTSFTNGSFQYIKFTHKPSNNLINLLKQKKSVFSDDFDKFFKTTTPGYGRCNEYRKIFKNDIVSTFGSEGKIVACDPFGLHRGTSVNEPRIVTWIRYGNAISRQKIVSAEEIRLKKVRLNFECKKILSNSKFGYLLNDFII